MWVRSFLVLLAIMAASSHVTDASGPNWNPGILWAETLGDDGQQKTIRIKRGNPWTDLRMRTVKRESLVESDVGIFLESEVDGEERVRKLSRNKRSDPWIDLLLRTTEWKNRVDSPKNIVRQGNWANRDHDG